MKDIFKFLIGAVKPLDLLKLVLKGIGLDQLVAWHQQGYRKAGREAAPDVPADKANAIADAAVRGWLVPKLPK